MMIIRIIYELLYRKALFLYIFLLHFSQTMFKNHKMFGNTSIIIMVGKVILLLVNAQQIVKVVIILGNHLLYLDIINHGHVTRLQVFEYDMIPLDIIDIYIDTVF